jgi:hypothetical protein
MQTLDEDFHHQQPRKQTAFAYFSGAHFYGTRSWNQLVRNFFLSAIIHIIVVPESTPPLLLQTTTKAATSRNRGSSDAARERHPTAFACLLLQKPTPLPPPNASLCLSFR